MVPAHLVRKILKGEYVDMVELLKDNMDLLPRVLHKPPSQNAV